MVTDYYTRLPATLRGSALEAHTGWPRTWAAPDNATALDVLDTLVHVTRTGGIADRYAMWIVSDNDGATVTVDRTDVDRDRQGNEGS